MNLNHVRLATTDIKKFKNFYSKYFGFVSDESEYGVNQIVNYDGFTISLVEDDNVQPEKSIFNLGFNLETYQEVVKLFEKIKNEDSSIIVKDLELSENDYAKFSIKDPSGYIVNISWIMQ